MTLQEALRFTTMREDELSIIDKAKLDEIIEDDEKELAKRPYDNYTKKSIEAWKTIRSFLDRR